jgi:hypothetical protein
MNISWVVVSRKERSLGKTVIPIEDFLFEK